MALQILMSEYGFLNRSEMKLKAGLSRLRRMREYTLGNLKAENPHELMRSLEILNLMDVSECVLLAAMSTSISMRKREDGTVEFKTKSVGT